MEVVCRNNNRVISYVGIIMWRILSEKPLQCNSHLNRSTLFDRVSKLEAPLQILSDIIQYRWRYYRTAGTSCIYQLDNRLLLGNKCSQIDSIFDRICTRTSASSRTKRKYVRDKSFTFCIILKSREKFVPRVHDTHGLLHFPLYSFL